MRFQILSASGTLLERACVAGVFGRGFVLQQLQFEATRGKLENPYLTPASFRRREGGSRSDNDLLLDDNSS